VSGLAAGSTSGWSSRYALGWASGSGLGLELGPAAVSTSRLLLGLAFGPVMGLELRLGDASGFANPT